MRRVLIDRTPRTKLLNFRVSAEELGLLIQSADAAGARSVSEYIRAVALTGAARDLAASRAGLDLERLGPSGGLEPTSMRVQRILKGVEAAIRSVRREMTKE